MKPHEPIALKEILAARERIAGVAIRTPLVRLNVDDAPAEIYLKLENLQPINSFKIRGAGNAIAVAPAEALADGVYTASAGNMAQGVAWNARRLGLTCTVIVPDSAPETKLAAITRLGARLIKVPYSEWWQVMIDHRYGPMERGLFIHPSSDPAVMAGNGTIGLEVLEDLPEVDTIIVPYGSGGLSSGIASAVRASKAKARVFACEVETGAPLAASLAAGVPTEVTYIPSFVDGIGARTVLEEIFPLVRQLLDGSLVVTLAEVAHALRLLVERNRIVAEGAGAAPVAAALRGMGGKGKIVCIVSGGNINTERLAKVIMGELP